MPMAKVRAPVSSETAKENMKQTVTRNIPAIPTQELPAEPAAQRWSGICVGGGWLSLSAKPALAGGKLDEQMMNVTCVAVLLKDDEDWNRLQMAYASRDLDVIKLPFSCSKLDVETLDDTDAESLRGVSRICDALQDGHSVLIHCAAGLHRTGVVAYMLLRMLGKSKNETLRLATLHVGLEER